jgi:arylsulfatase A-like enzyme
MTGETMNRFLLLLALAALLVAAGCAREPDYNVLVITIDTLRPDRLGCYGYERPTSPRIDRFAAGSVLFEQAVCSAPQTLPSHTSIFTGQHIRTHKAIGHESVVPAEATTLAETLKARGYQTTAFISSHVLDRRYGLDQGFDRYWQVNDAMRPRQREVAQERGIDPTTNEAIRWLEENASGKFFAWIHWFHPHRPYAPPLEIRPRFVREYLGDADSSTEFVVKVWREQIDLADEDVRYLSDLYDGEIAFTDEQVGRVLDALEALGVADRTIVVITSDHGEMLYEHEYYFGHDIALYEECIMVPLIIYHPGLRVTPKRLPGLVQSIDIFPTVLDFLGIDIPGGTEGKTLGPLVMGAETRTTEHAFSETFPFPEKAMPRHAVRSEGLKLIWREDREGALTKHLYDLRSDPGEMMDLYPADPDAARPLDRVLHEWTGPDGLHPAPIPTAEEAGRIQILRSLGYLE